MGIWIFYALVFCAASTGAIFKPGDWYEALNKPGWTPPNWAFPLVWSVLYIGIGYAGWLVWKAGPVWPALAFWGAQLVLNAAWSYIFFGRRRMDIALIEVAGLWLSIAGFMVAAYPASPLAALLFAPYLLWVTIAATLNRSVLKLNPDADIRGAGA